MTETLIKLWQDMADHTRRVCMKPDPRFGTGDCPRPGSCCSPEYCDMAMQIAEERGEVLRPTGHPTLPLMGIDATGAATGCTAPPHHRPLCSLHVCCINGAGFKVDDLPWTEEYFKIRDQISEEEYAARDREAPSADES
jgi:hypothetical protein